MDLALFDFDGTITRKDTFTDFTFQHSSLKDRIKAPWHLGPMVIGYKLGLVTGSAIRKRVAHFCFRGKSRNQVLMQGDAYARQVIPNLIRPEAAQRIHWHQNRGDRVVIVSASLDVYLSTWCHLNHLDLICTQLEHEAGRFTGAYQGEDCVGTEKARRILSMFTMNDYACVYAYGDTAGDCEMLALADRKFYRGNEFD